jgi:hypothetical protein
MCSGSKFENFAFELGWKGRRNGLGGIEGSEDGAKWDHRQHELTFEDETGLEFRSILVQYVEGVSTATGGDFTKVTGTPLPRGPEMFSADFIRCDTEKNTQNLIKIRVLRE